MLVSMADIDAIFDYVTLFSFNEQYMSSWKRNYIFYITLEKSNDLSFILTAISQMIS